MTRPQTPPTHRFSITCKNFFLFYVGQPVPTPKECEAQCLFGDFLLNQSRSKIVTQKFGASLSFGIEKYDEAGNGQSSVCVVVLKEAEVKQMTSAWFAVDAIEKSTTNPHDLKVQVVAWLDHTYINFSKILEKYTHVVTEHGLRVPADHLLKSADFGQVNRHLTLTVSARFEIRDFRTVLSASLTPSPTNVGRFIPSPDPIPNNGKVDAAEHELYPPFVRLDFFSYAHTASTSAIATTKKSSSSTPGTATDNFSTKARTKLGDLGNATDLGGGLIVGNIPKGNLIQDGVVFKEVSKIVPSLNQSSTVIKSLSKATKFTPVLSIGLNVASVTEAYFKFSLDALKTERQFLERVQGVATSDDIEKQLQKEAQVAANSEKYRSAVDRSASACALIELAAAMITQLDAASIERKETRSANTTAFKWKAGASLTGMSLTVAGLLVAGYIASAPVSIAVTVGAFVIGVAVDAVSSAGVESAWKGINVTLKDLAEQNQVEILAHSKHAGPCITCKVRKLLDDYYQSTQICLAPTQGAKIPYISSTNAGFKLDFIDEGNLNFEFSPSSLRSSQLKV